MATPKLFPNIVAGVLEALEMSFGKGLYADKVVERLLRQNKKWGYQKTMCKTSWHK